MRQLTQQELYDILYGCTILGTGGGGSLEVGLELIDKALADGKHFRLASLDEVPDEDLIITPYYCGAISPETDEIRQHYGHLKEMEGHPVVKAVQVIEEYLSKSISGVISTELGGGNTAAAFYAGACLDKYIVDADPAGRSVPELQQSLYFINDLAMAPISVVNLFGESAIITEVVDDFRAEALVRSLAVVSKNIVAVADHPTTGKKLKTAVISGAISYALDIGRAYREAKEMKVNPASAVATVGNGLVAFEGHVREFKWDTLEGFTVGEVTMTGSGRYDGRELKIWFKNEHIVSWLDGKPYVNVPDLICLFHAQSGLPISNPYYEIGMPITMVVLPSPAEWTTPRGLEVFSARYFGFDIDYVPFATRVMEMEVCK